MVVFSLQYTFKLPNDNLELLLYRAEHLDGHGSLMGQGGAQEQMGNRPVRYEQIDVPIFLNKIRDIPIPINYTNDVTELANNISKFFYDCGSSCLIKNEVSTYTATVYIISERGTRYG